MILQSSHHTPRDERGVRDGIVETRMLSLHELSSEVHPV